MLEFYHLETNVSFFKQHETYFWLWVWLGAWVCMKQSSVVCLPACTPGLIDLSQLGRRLVLIVCHHILFPHRLSSLKMLTCIGKSSPLQFCLLKTSLSGDMWSVFTRAQNIITRLDSYCKSHLTGGCFALVVDQYVSLKKIHKKLKNETNWSERRKYYPLFTNIFINKNTLRS